MAAKTRPTTNCNSFDKSVFNKYKPPNNTKINGTTKQPILLPFSIPPPFIKFRPTAKNRWPSPEGLNFSPAC
ncbi:TPA: hypothetical protein DD455_00480 [Candidatus Shapirobacteria bacterium]|nr:hypothetical protein [Candidatus Shapirobacteria bacterium]